MAMTSYLRTALGNHAIGKASFLMPTVYMGLFTSSPGEFGSLAGEPGSGSYARVEATSKFGSFDTISGIATNSSIITFPAPTGSWGTLLYMGLIDSVVFGNVLTYDPLPTPRTVASGGRAVQFPVGTLALRLF